MPNAKLLTRTLALTRDEDVGIVQTPQNFFNPDPIQANLAVAGVWPDEQRFFFDFVLLSKDAWGGAFCCGTSSVIRYSVSQLLVATDIAKSVVWGLIRPIGHKFKVTAKGGDRSHGMVQWAMLRIFLVYLAFTAAGVIWEFSSDGTR